LPSGPDAPNPADLLGSTKMQELLCELSGRYNFVIIDTPPMLTFNDARLLAGLVDGVLLVARTGNSPRQAVRRARQFLDEVRAPVLGVVLTAVRPTEMEGNGASGH
jgi:non-specific protein-tyrosine kinase